MNDLNKYGLLNSLLGIINNYDEDDSKVIIAKYFLKHFDRLDEINIFDAADECFVTRTSIRRFAKFIGFDNFRHLKKDHEQYDYYLQFEEKSNYPEYLANQITQMATNLRNRIGGEVEEVVEAIIGSREIVFLVSDIYGARCLEFQKEMIFSGKMVRIVSYNFSDSKVLKRIDPDDLVIVISVLGSFIYQMNDLINQLECRKAIMTSIEDSNMLSNFDLILPMGEVGSPSSKTVYHTLAIEYYLDVVYHEYQRQVKKGT
ncbi:MurR/RpiR family transcriptional regulator [Candidatus Enterococcus murrayae]|uniref:MurR/RpiR family transcriptional regulator n=1 Tax=Candidatus Enterococcus murrayae TaxID=2815321 RepID=A0ABS3HHC1_9ENTE|nr:MurR/RpiR family transcriptional regulator [Enterococcus sp. MJM16]MBO0452859.1 MurR/RpiR family transcriptional regulator [Enterococcus sp. MJM16]